MPSLSRIPTVCYSDHYQGIPALKQSAIAVELIVSTCVTLGLLHSVFAAGPSRGLVRQRRSFETNSPGRARSNKKRRCLIPVSEEAPEIQEEHPDTPISALPADVLVKIFSTLDLRLHRFVLPLVCRQW